MIVDNIKDDLKDYEPEFVKLYTKYIKNIWKLPKGSDKLLRLMAIGLEFNSNTVYADKYIKELWAKELGYKSVNQVEQQITRLVSEKLVLRVARGRYKISPLIIGKGSWEEIKKCRSAWIHIHIKNGEEYITTGME